VLVQEQWHSAGSWRSLAAFSAFSAAWAGVSYGFRLTAFFAIVLPIALLAAFLAGYCYRQFVLDRGERPKQGFLVLKDDPLLGPNDGDA
jgi:hypothetical protein